MDEVLGWIRSWKFWNFKYILFYCDFLIYHQVCLNIFWFINLIVNIIIDYDYNFWISITKTKLVQDIIRLKIQIYM